MDELKKKPWYQNALPSDQDDMQSFVKQLERVVREDERYRCMDEISNAQQEHNVARHGEDYDTAYDRAIDYINPVFNTSKDETN